jgi:hypothetical protein
MKKNKTNTKTNKQRNIYLKIKMFVISDDTVQLLLRNIYLKIKMFVISDDTVQLLLRNMYETRFNISQTYESIEAHNSSHVFEIVSNEIPYFHLKT